MEDLEIGDEVLTVVHRGRFTQPGKAKYEPVYGFGHYHKKHSSEFVQLFYSRNNATDPSELQPLELTGNHLVFIEGHANPIRADAVKTNACFVSAVPGNIEALCVRDIKRITKQGVYAPLTASGTIVVHDYGILASTYISIQDTTPEFVTFENGIELTSLPQQVLCHMWMAPHRLVCLPPFGSSSNFCRGETYDDKGEPWWVRFGQDVSDFVDSKHTFMQIPLLGVILVCLVLAALMERVLTASIINVTMCVAVASVLYRLRWSSYDVRSAQGNDLSPKNGGIKRQGEKKKLQ